MIAVNRDDFHRNIDLPIRVVDFLQQLIHFRQFARRPVNDDARALRVNLHLFCRYNRRELFLHVHGVSIIQGEGARLFGRFFVRLRAVHEPRASVFHQRYVRRLGHQLQGLLRRHIMQCQRDVAANIIGDDNIITGQSRQPG